MADRTVRASALAGLLEPGVRGDRAPALSLSEQRPCLALLRVRAGDTAGADSVRRQLKIEFPLAVNVTASAAGVTVLGLGPDEWLVADADGSAGAALAAAGLATTDVTAGRTVLRVSGSPARDMLAKGCPVDLHPRTFAPGRCIQTAIARTNVLIHLIDATPTFDLYVTRSYARSFLHWLEDACREYGLRVL